MKLFIKAFIIFIYSLWANHPINIINHKEDYTYLNTWLLLTQKKGTPLNFKKIQFDNLTNTVMSAHRINIAKQLGLQTNQDLYYFQSISLLSQIDRSLYQDKILYFNTQKDHTIELYLDGILIEKNKSFITIESKYFQFAKNICLKVSSPKNEFNQGLLLAASKKNNIQISLDQKQWLRPLSRYQTQFENKHIFVRYFLNYKLKDGQALEVSHSPNISNILFNQQTLERNIITQKSLKEKNIISYKTQIFPLFFINELNLKPQFFQEHKFTLFSRNFSIQSNKVSRAYIYIEKNRQRYFIGVSNEKETIFQIPKELFGDNNKIIIISLGKENNHTVKPIPQDFNLGKKLFLNFSNNKNISFINFDLFHNSPIFQNNNKNFTTQFYIDNLKFDYFLDFFTYHKQFNFKYNINILPEEIYLNGKKINISKRLREQGLIVGKNTLKIINTTSNKGVIYPYLTTYPLETKTIFIPRKLPRYPSLKKTPQKIEKKNILSKQEALFIYQSLNLPKKKFEYWYKQIK